MGSEEDSFSLIQSMGAKDHKTHGLGSCHSFIGSIAVHVNTMQPVLFTYTYTCLFINYQPIIALHTSSSGICVPIRV